jgi:hypothetical protein
MSNPETDKRRPGALISALLKHVEKSASNPETNNTPTGEGVFDGPTTNRHNRLNLGCGHAKIPGWTNIDSEPTENPDIVADLGAHPWPFGTDTVDEAIASHILEHLTTKSFFHFMKELYRVLKPNAICGIVIPHPRHNVYLNDPTHRNPVTPDTLAMFCQRNFRAMLETTGGRLTPFWRYSRIDFDMAGDLQCVLDPRITEAQRESGEWKTMEVVENNVVSEWRFGVRAVKPFIDMGEPDVKA